MIKKVVFSVSLIFLFNFICAAQESFPSLNIKSVSGKLLNVNDLVESSKDTMLVMAFWATWCIPCINELESINEVYKEKQAERPFKFIAVSVDDSRTSQRVKPFITGKGWGFDVLIDINSDLKRALNITDVPHTIIFKDGKIVYRHTGYLIGEEENLFEEIKKL
jgi:thiol-disulfide isomerase/thioredoxin